MSDPSVDDDMVEMRFNVPRRAYDVFDAVRIGRNQSKSAMAMSIILEWAAREVHVSTVVQRITRGKAPVSQANWDNTGD